MRVIRIEQKADWQKFHAVPRLIYQGDPNYIAPLESDVENVFNPQKNRSFNHGDAQCFVLEDASGNPLGRIAAFIDHLRNESNEYPIGGLGFFECVDDLEAAKHLFEAAHNYLKKWDVKAIDGPINFGERDKFWGLLVEGEAPPLYRENYHPAYYQAFFQAMGYRPYEQILTFHGKVIDVPIKRFSSIAERVSKRYGLYTKKLCESNTDTFAQHFAQVYNLAFKDNPYFKPIQKEVIQKMFKQMRQILDDKMIAITYQDDRPVAFVGFIPDINPFLRGFRGKLNFLRTPVFLWRLKSTRKHLLKGIAFGIDPAYQRLGAFAVLINDCYTQHTLKRYSDFYLATIRGHNTVMIKSIENLGVKTQRVHLAFRKMMDPGLPLSPFEFSEAHSS